MELDVLLTTLLLVPFGALIGISAWHIHKKAVKEAIKESDPLRMPGGSSKESIWARDRAESRALYERVVKEKLDVIKMAIAMGYTQQEIKALDNRLEELIGTDKLQGLLEDDAAPPLDPDLMNDDLTMEISRLKQGIRKEETD